MNPLTSATGASASNQLIGLQALRAKQALSPIKPEPKPTGLPIYPVKNPEAFLQAEDAACIAGSCTGSKNPLNKVNIPTQDIQAVAERLGYVDLGEKAIERAYYNGQSLLADYTA